MMASSHERGRFVLVPINRGFKPSSLQCLKTDCAYAGRQSVVYSLVIIQFHLRVRLQVSSAFVTKRMQHSVSPFWTHFSTLCEIIEIVFSTESDSTASALRRLSSSRFRCSSWSCKRLCFDRLRRSEGFICMYLYRPFSGLGLRASMETRGSRVSPSSKTREV
jgi:hypothetical protein